MKTESDMLHSKRPNAQEGIIVHPSLNDIIVGRGNLNSNHPGNVSASAVPTTLGRCGNGGQC